MKSILLILATFYSTTTMAADYQLKDFGGNEAQTYYGTNESVWFKRSCKVQILGIPSTPVVMISVADSDNLYTLWTFSPTFQSDFGGDSLSVAATDSIRQIQDGSSSGRSIYDNSKRSDTEESSLEIKLRASLFTGKLMMVQLKHLDLSKKVVGNEITCTDLKRVFAK